MIDFKCECGFEMSNETLGGANQGRIISNQDFAEVIDFYRDLVEQACSADPSDKDVMRRLIPQVMNLALYARPIYECPNCRRIHINEGTRESRYVFKPEIASKNRSVLWSVEGKDWKGFVRGGWSKWSDNKLHGTLEWNTNVSDGLEVYDTWDELQEKYNQKFEELHSKDLLKSATLRQGDEIIHSYPSDDE